MSTPPLGMITVPYWEWWLHHHPFRRYSDGLQGCKICASDTSCHPGCPQKAIEQKIEEIVLLMRQWRTDRLTEPVKPRCKPMGEGVQRLTGHCWNQDGTGCECGMMKVKGGFVYFGDSK